MYYFVFFYHINHFIIPIWFTFPYDHFSLAKYAIIPWTTLLWINRDIGSSYLFWQTKLSARVFLSRCSRQTSSVVFVHMDLFTWNDLLSLCEFCLWRHTQMLAHHILQGTESKQHLPPSILNRQKTSVFLFVRWSTQTQSCPVLPWVFLLRPYQDIISWR